LSLRVAVVDDEPLACALLSSMLEAFDDVEVVGAFTDPHDFLAGYSALSPDIVFLDIRMPQLDGFDLLAQLPPGELQVVFVTAYDEFAIRAFEIAAADYILKPFDEERLELTLLRLRGRYTSEQRERVLETVASLRSDPYLARIATWKGERIALRPVGEIRFFEAIDKRVLAHPDGEPEVVRSTIVALERILDPRAFLRISRRHLVNLDHVREIRPWFHGDYQIVVAGGRMLRATKGFREPIDRLLRLHTCR
jgi:two-component system LytT family response regulator